MIYLQNLWFSCLLRWSQAKGKCRAHVRLPRFFINLPCWWNVDISSKTLEKADTQQSNAEICLIPLNRYGYKIYKIYNIYKLYELYKIYNLFIWLKTIKNYKNLRQSPVFCGSKRSFYLSHHGFVPVPRTRRRSSRRNTTGAMAWFISWDLYHG